jgi:hypothetical protein
MSEYPSAEDELKTMTLRMWDQVEVTEKAFAEINQLKAEVARLREQASIDQTTAAELSGQYTNEQAELRAEVARLRKALRYIASRPTDQLAAPQQCSMVAVAMEALAAVRDNQKEEAK